MPVAITGIGRYLPADRLSSEEAEDRVNRASTPFVIPPGIVKLVSGVEYRHHAAPPLHSGDLAASAAAAALEDGGRDPVDMDLLIFASASTALSEPATANLVQDELGCTNARVLDVKNACNSFVDALDVARSFIETGRAGRALVVAGEVNSPVIGWRIRDRQDLAHRLAGLTLGDAGAACVVEWVNDDRHCLLPGHFESDGSHWPLSVVMSGGNMLRDDYSSFEFDCDSMALQKVAVERVPPAVRRGLDGVGWSPQDVSLVVPHQVSLHAIDTLCELSGIDPARALRTLPLYGNTAAASIPLALSIAKDAGQLERGDRVLLVGASAGFSVGVIPLVWR